MLVVYKPVDDEYRYSLIIYDETHEFHVLEQRIEMNVYVPRSFSALLTAVMRKQT